MESDRISTTIDLLICNDTVTFPSAGFYFSSVIQMGKALVPPHWLPKIGYWAGSCNFTVRQAKPGKGEWNNLKPFIGTQRVTNSRPERLD
jgi:hypothetical protein